MWVNFEVLPVTFGGKTANHGNLTEVTVYKRGLLKKKHDFINATNNHPT
jgi:hypothetical protein